MGAEATLSSKTEGAVVADGLFGPTLECLKLRVKGQEEVRASGWV